MNFTSTQLNTANTQYSKPSR